MHTLHLIDEIKVDLAAIPWYGKSIANAGAVPVTAICPFGTPASAA